MAEQAGVKFRFNTPVDQLLCDGEQIYGVKCGDEVIKADAYVMAFWFLLDGDAQRHC